MANGWIIAIWGGLAYATGALATVLTVALLATPALGAAPADESDAPMDAETGQQIAVQQP